MSHLLVSLLDRVFARYGMRFHKDRDSVRLAAMLEPPEIASEIRKIVHELGRVE
jgi:hypothetical protein